MHSQVGHAVARALELAQGRAQMAKRLFERHQAGLADLLLNVLRGCAHGIRVTIQNSAAIDGTNGTVVALCINRPSTLAPAWTSRIWREVR